MEEITKIQRDIERIVTNGRGYDRKNTSRTPQRFRDIEIGLQIALANMDVCDGKLDLYEVLDFGTRLDRMVKKFNDARIPLEVITTADGFREAFITAYCVEGSDDLDLSLPPFSGDYENLFYKKFEESTNFTDFILGG